MAIAPTGPDTVAREAGASTQPWPSERAGFYILFCVIFATFWKPTFSLNPVSVWL